MRFKTAAIAAAAITPSLAVPVPLSDRDPIANDTVVCEVTNADDGESWTVQVGRPYIQGAGCGGIFDTMKKHTAIHSLECNSTAGSNDQTLLYFTVPYVENIIERKHVTDGLQEAYRMVPLGQSASCSAVSKKFRRDGEMPGIWSEPNDLDVPIASDTALCNYGIDDKFVYDMRIGRAFIEGKGCQPILVTLEQHGKISDYECNPAAFSDQTMLYFKSSSEADDIFAGLKEAYPMVSFDVCCPGCTKKDKPESRRDEVALSTTVPIERRDIKDPIPDDTAVCETKYGGAMFLSDWTVQVGRPFIDGLGCDPILATMKEHGNQIEKWDCISTERFGFDQTVLNLTISLAGKQNMDDVVSGLPYGSFGQAPGCGTPKKRSESRRDEISPIWYGPVQQEDLSPIPADSAACETQNGGSLFLFDWSVQVGRPFIDGKGCDPILVTLQKHWYIENFVCSATRGFDQTVLNFSAFMMFKGDRAKIVAGLQEAYPMVPFDKAPGCESKRKSKSRRDEIASNFAALVEERDLGPVATDSARCKKGMGPRSRTATWFVQVDRSYAGGKDCDSTLATLNKYRGPITDYVCNVTAESDQTTLYFTTEFHKFGLVINGLSEAYPGINFSDIPSCSSTAHKSPPTHPHRRAELDLWGNIWPQAHVVPTTSEDPIHMFAAKTSTAGVMGYDIQIHVPYDANAVCNYVYGLLQQAAQINEWACIDDNLGGTAIKFTALNRASDHCQPGIYEMINQAYPQLNIIAKRPGYPGDCPIPSGWPTSDTPIIP